MRDEAKFARQRDDGSRLAMRWAFFSRCCRAARGRGRRHHGAQAASALALVLFVVAKSDDI